MKRNKLQSYQKGQARRNYDDLFLFVTRTELREGSAPTPADDDDEDLLGYSFEDDLSVSFELGGVNMKFKDSALEAKYG